MGSQSKGKKVRAPQKPMIGWRKTPEGQYVPIVSFAHLVMALEPRPVHGFLKGERDAILVWIKQAMSECLFGVPYLLVNPVSGMCAKNPDWDLQPYYEKHPTIVGALQEVVPEPTSAQVEAGNCPSLDIVDSSGADA
jgi:hypothetical protein